MEGFIKRQLHDDGIICREQEVVVTSLYIIRFVWNFKCMLLPLWGDWQATTTAHAQCAPYWEQEVGLLLKLLYHFHEIVVLYTALIATMCFLPDYGPECHPTQQKQHGGGLDQQVK